MVNAAISPELELTFDDKYTWRSSGSSESWRAGRVGNGLDRRSADAVVSDWGLFGGTETKKHESEST